MYYGIHFGGYPAQPQLHNNKVASYPFPDQIYAPEDFTRGCEGDWPQTNGQLWRRLYIRGVEEFVERLHGYRPGGYHPVHLHDRLHDGWYRVIHKLGYGGYSTVWLCRDTSSDTPKYVAVKILVASESERECRELLVNRLKAEAIEKNPGGEHICLPLDQFDVHGPNGTHICLVYPETVDKIQQDVSRQVVEALSALHNRGTRHGDFRPSNILLRLDGLDGLDEEEIFDLFGEPESTHVARQPLPTKFGIPMDYRAPEMILDGSASTTADLWSLGCTLFEIRTGQRLFSISTLLGRDKGQYLTEVALLIGRPSDPWWTSWDYRDRIFETSKDPDCRTVKVRPGALDPRTPDPRSIREKLATCHHCTWSECAHELHQLVPEVETKLLADLLGKLLRYEPGERLAAQDVLKHDWFKI
ncbi:Serine/threonine-protein kinase-like protein [Phialemonium atrogriseum]|uniref:non-specific serine/threonine protein kinase n=1 Tax=Phialemonium atrogriseum TaxID=1093897 RepID=A0AAJ0BTA6_9PEZI|nr:Serine/threonine-protein kinase-like protein [Phialemonium atrogriseum]KAK1763008.1 Serine/threonine-protein kinase-like protein [Phialemonium atrogriseum]